MTGAELHDVWTVEVPLCWFPDRSVPGSSVGRVRAKASGRVDVYTQGRLSSPCVGLDSVAVWN